MSLSNAIECISLSARKVQVAVTLHCHSDQSWASLIDTVTRGVPDSGQQRSPHNDAIRCHFEDAITANLAGCCWHDTHSVPLAARTAVLVDD
jgi:hypothetical protein